MKRYSELKQALSQKLDVMISSVELRIKLNHQVLRSLHSVDAACQALNIADSFSPVSIEQQAKKAESKIIECQQEVHKLQLLKGALPRLESYTALRLYQETSELTVHQFERNLSSELKKTMN